MTIVCRELDHCGNTLTQECAKMQIASVDLITVLGVSGKKEEAV